MGNLCSDTALEISSVSFLASNLLFLQELATVCGLTPKNCTQRDPACIVLSSPYSGAVDLS